MNFSFICHNYSTDVMVPGDASLVGSFGSLLAGLNPSYLL